MGFENTAGADGEHKAFLSTDGKRFYLRPGLNNEEDTVSFESADMRGYYLRVYSSLLDLENKDGARDAAGFDNAATFKGYHGKWYSGYMAFESRSMAGHYIRHREGRLRLEQPDSTTLYEEDASWRMSKGK